MKRLTASPKAGNYPPSSNDPDKGFGGSDDKDLSKTPLLGSNDSLVGEKYNMVTIFFYNTPKKKKKKLLRRSNETLGGGAAEGQAGLGTPDSKRQRVEASS